MEFFCGFEHSQKILSQINSSLQRLSLPVSVVGHRSWESIIAKIYNYNSIDTTAIVSVSITITDRTCWVIYHQDHLALSNADLVQSHNEWSFSLLKELYGLNGLRLEAVHDVDDKYGDVTQRWASCTQVTISRRTNQHAVDWETRVVLRGRGFYLNDSCPGVSIMRRPGTLRFSRSNWNTNTRRVMSRSTETVVPPSSEYSRLWRMTSACGWLLEAHWWLQSAALYRQPLRPVR